MSRKQLDRSGGDLSHLGRDDTGCGILHVDMDAFFASVELLSRPELAGRPVIVGGAGNRGVVVSATYEARAFGIHAAMPMARARAQCPQAVVIPPSHGLYSKYSKAVMGILGDVTEALLPLSIDEAFLDVAPAIRRLGSPATIAASLRAEVKSQTGLTCSVGVASSMLVAKLASTRSKPNGLLVVPKDQVTDFLHPMPVQALPGVGPSTQAALSRYGIATVGELAAARPDLLVRILGQHGETLHRYANGVDNRRVEPQEHDRSISAERTFETDIGEVGEAKRQLLRLSDHVARRLRTAGLVAGALGLKMRRPDFSTISRSITLAAPTDVAQEIYEALEGVLETAMSSGVPRVRLLGVRTAMLSAAGTSGRQAMLTESEHGRREAEEASDAVIAKFGNGAISPASLLKAPGAGSDSVSKRPGQRL